MADPSDISDSGDLAPGIPQVKNARNLSGTKLVMVLSGLVAAVAFLYATSQGSDKVAVAVVTAQPTLGQTMASESIGRALVELPDRQLETVVRSKDLSKYNGWVFASALEPGELLTKSSLRPPSDPDGLRTMSIPVSNSRAVGGAIRAGDRIDVVDTTGGFPGGYAASNLRVVAVQFPDNPQPNESIDSSVVVALSAEDAFNISKALAGQKFDLVKSTGAPPPTATPPSSTATTRS